jgi:hypothetical protein
MRREIERIERDVMRERKKEKREEMRKRERIERDVMRERERKKREKREMREMRRAR